MKTLDLPRRPKTEAILAKEARAEATQCVVSWLQKLKPEKRPDKPGNRAPSEPDAPQFPPDRNSLVLVIGSLVLIFVMIAILLASDISPDKNAKRELDSAAPNAENTQQHPIGVKPGPVRLDDAPASTTPHWVFPPPTQTAVIRGLPGSPYRGTGRGAQEYRAGSRRPQRLVQAGRADCQRAGRTAQHHCGPGG